MNSNRWIMATKILSVFLITIALTGCYSFSSMSKNPEFSDNVIPTPTDKSSEKIGYVSNINVKQNNSVTNINDGFVNRVIGKLQQSNYFNEVTYGLYTKKPTTPYYDLTFNIDENPDMNMGGNLTKAFFTGFSLFLLAPVLPNTYDFSADHYLLVTRPDGTKREYKASCAGSATGTFPYTGLITEYNKIAGDVTERCLTSVINQFTAEK